MDLNNVNTSAYNLVRTPQISFPLKNQNYDYNNKTGLPVNDSHGGQLPWALSNSNQSLFYTNVVVRRFGNVPQLGDRRFAIVAYIGVNTIETLQIQNANQCEVTFIFGDDDPTYTCQTTGETRECKSMMSDQSGLTAEGCARGCSINGYQCINDACQKTATGFRDRQCSSTPCVTSDARCNPYLKTCVPVTVTNGKDSPIPYIRYQDCDKFCNGTSSCSAHGTLTATSCICSAGYSGETCNQYNLNYGSPKRQFLTGNGHIEGGTAGNYALVHAAFTLATFTTSLKTVGLDITLSFTATSFNASGSGCYTLGAMIIDVTTMENINGEWNRDFGSGSGLLYTAGAYSPREQNDHNGGLYNMIRNGDCSTGLQNGTRLQLPIPNENDGHGDRELPAANNNQSISFTYTKTIVSLNNKGVEGRRFAIVAYLGVSTNGTIKINNGTAAYVRETM